MKTQAAIQFFIYNRRSLNRRSTTISWHERNLKPFGSCYRKLPTDPKAIEKFLAEVVPDEQDENRHGHYRSLKALYRFTCRRHHMFNPMDLVDPPSRRKKVRPTLSSQEMNRLTSHAKDSLRDRTLLSLFIDSGPRASEACTLRKQNIFEDYIKVDGKSGEREIPISEETRCLLLALASSNGAGDYVFSNKRGLPLTRHGVYWIIRGYMRKAGINGPKLGPHRIRHAFGKHYIKNGGDTRSLQKIMGHSNITTTEIYVELANEEIVAKHHRYTPLHSSHAAAQQNFFDTDKTQAIKEAEEILRGGGKSN